MPSFVVSSVDTSANALTSTGIAAAGGAANTVLTTGDRCRVRNVGGALPSPLVAATDYFAVRLTDDSIQLSDTNAHALAGTNIVDLTTAGSGTTTVEFGLPYALPTVIPAPGVQIDSRRWLRPGMDALVALYDLLTGQAQSVFSGVTLAVPLSLPARQDVRPGVAALQQGGSAASLDITTGAIVSGGPSAWMYPLTTHTGSVPTAVVIAAFGNASAGAAVALIRVTSAGAVSTLASGNIVAAPASWADYTFNVGSPVALGAREALFLTVSPTAASLKVNNVGVVYGPYQL